MEKDYFDLYGNKRETIQLSMPKEIAKATIMRGLQYYVGDKAQWIDDYDMIAQWLEDNHRRGMILHGSNGVGKSIICTKILPVIFKHYMNIPSTIELISCVKATEIEHLFDKDLPLQYSKILIIDDVGAESISSYYGTKRDFVSELVDMCEDMGRLLIITTNLTPNEIGERYGLRTLDRLHSITHSFTIEHESMRK